MVVHHDGQRLAEDQRAPDHEVAPARAELGLRRLREHRERELAHHTEERPDAEHLEWDAHQILMEQRRDYKHAQSRHSLTITSLCDRYVHVSDGPQVHGHVPRAPEHGDVVGVPPVAVEVAVREVEQLAHEVQERVEGEVEEAEPD